MEPILPDRQQTPPPSEPTKKGWTLLAWVVILATVVTIIAVRTLPLAQTLVETAQAQDARTRLVLLELQGRYIVGATNVIGQGGADFYAEAKKLNRGSIEQRLHFIPLAGELAGPKEALEQLKGFDEFARKEPLTDGQRRLRDILGRLYADYARAAFDAPSVGHADQAFLSDEMGWFGDLALNPAQGPDAEERAEALRPAFITFGAVVLGVFLAVFVAALGFVGAIAFLVLALMGFVRWRIKVGVGHHGVYAETFALWLLIYFSMNAAAAMINLDVPFLVRGCATMLASLVVLAWPLVRGIPWRQMRQDLGFFCESNPLVEIAAGIWCYIINLPLVGIGVALTLLLMLLQNQLRALEAGGAGEEFTSAPEPTHPVLQFFLDPDWTTRILLFVLASVIAPIVEETMFRGVLHRHCRELTGRWAPLASALFSTTLVSFLFAAIHPQGLVAIPPLMFMAFGFSLAREWRGSLLPSIFAHGMSNGTVLTLAMIALSK